MPLDPETRDKLVRALAHLGCSDTDRRAAAAALIDRFVKSLGGWDAVVAKPRARPKGAAAGGVSASGSAASEPDTKWRRLRANPEGCRGSWRRYYGVVLVVRECRQPVPGADRPSKWRCAPEQWYITRNGKIFTLATGEPQVYHTEAHAQMMAEQGALAED